MSRHKLRNPPRDFWERSRKRLRTLEQPQSHPVRPFLARRTPKRARDDTDHVPSKKAVSRRVSRPKRPLHELSASHMHVGLVAPDAVHSTSTSTAIDSSSATIITIKQAKSVIGSTAAARGVLMPLGPKLASRF